MQRERGFALLVVMLTIAVASMLVVAATQSVRSTVRVIGADVRDAQRSALLEAALATTVAFLIDPDSTRRWTADGRWRRIPIGTTDLVVRVQDANGLVDLNTADARLIKLLFEQVLGADDAGGLAAQVLARRSPVGSRQPPPQPAAARLAFQHPSQLRQLSGMTGALHQRLDGRATIYNANGLVNVMTAPRAILDAVPGLAARDIDQMLEARSRRSGTRDAAANLIRKAPGLLKTSQGPAFIISIGIADTTGRIVSALQATILAEPSTASMYQILDWNPGISIAPPGEIPS